MKKFSILALALVLLAAAVAAAWQFGLRDLARPAAPGALTKAEIAARLQSSTAVILAFRGMDRLGQPVGGVGSGAVIGRGLVATNHHVTEKALLISVRLTGQTKNYRAHVIASDPVADLALLSVEGLDAPSLDIATSANLKLGDDVFIMGNPLGEHEGTFATGVVSNLSQLHAPVPRVQYTIPTSLGNSGSPVLDAHGRIVAIHSNGVPTDAKSSLVRIENATHIKNTVTKAENLNSGVPADVLLHRIRETATPVHPVPHPRATAPGEPAAAAATAAASLPAPALNPALAFFPYEIRNFIVDGGAPAPFNEFKDAHAELERLQTQKRALEADVALPAVERAPRLATAREQLVRLALLRMQAAKAVTAAYVAAKLETPPPVPAGFAVQNIGADHAELVWQPVATTNTTYEIWDKPPPFAPGGALHATNQTTWRATALTADADYTIYLRAIRKNLVSEAAKISFKTLAFFPPSGLRLTARSHDTLTLAWDVPATSESGDSYEISLGDKTATTTQTTHRFSNLRPDTDHSISVRILRNKLRSAPVNLTAKTDVAPPGPVAGSPWEATLPGGVKMPFQPIPTGTFMMGGGAMREVTISRPFWMGKTEVTQVQWEAIMGKNPSHFKGANRPVERVSWNDAMAFCRKLTAQERASGRLSAGFVYTLPTEAQWEYACRAGTMTAFYFGNTLNGNEANCDGDNPCGTATKGPNLGRTADVGSYAPNAWGLYDMHGNVSEWCLDWYDSYPTGSATDPSGPDSGPTRVGRGGSWSGDASYCRSAHRIHSPPHFNGSDVGLRLVILPPVR